MIYTISEIRELITPVAKKHNLKAVYLFGSYAKGCATESSDVDLLIDTSGTSIQTLFDLGMEVNPRNAKSCSSQLWQHEQRYYLDDCNN